MRWLYGFLIFVLFSQLALASVQVKLDPFEIDHNFLAAKDGHFLGNVTVIFNELSNGTLETWIDGEKQDSLKLQDFYNYSRYSFTETNFSYQICANGTKKWTRWFDEPFTYQIRIRTLCNYMNPVEEKIDYQSPGPGVVNGSEGLKMIRNLTQEIGFCNGEYYHLANTSFTVMYVNTTKVSLTIRGACGNQKYIDWVTGKDGWIRTILLCPAGYYNQTYCVNNLCINCTGELDPAKWEKVGQSIIIKSYFLIYDPTSLGPNENDRRLYNGSLVGGIYKVESDGNLTYLEWGKDAYWWINWSIEEQNETPFTTTIIKHYDSQAAYLINFLPYTFVPPMKPFDIAKEGKPPIAYICAYTQINESRSGTWQDCQTFPEKAQTQHAVYHKNWTESEILTEIGGVTCPSPTGCDEVNVTDAWVELKSSTSLVNLKSNWSSGKLMVEAKTIYPTLAGTFNFTIPLSTFSKLKVPEEGGTLEVRVYTDSQLRSSDSAHFTVCQDGDGDSWCDIMGDCNDSDRDVCPGCPEICDGKDNDCDNETDEAFPELGSRCTLSGNLSDWQPNSPCGGYWTCRNGSLVCNATARPGEIPEICNNSIDDDCDGEIDEEVDYETYPNGTTYLALCQCQLGQVMPCGTDVGECQAGIRRCIQTPEGPDWGPCEGAIGPQEEICDGKDNDCNGKIDDIGGALSPQLTHCGCTGKTQAEVQQIMAGGEICCDDIDNNCNGLIDEGCRCCEPGEERSCAEIGLKGICATGVQVCQEDGSWGPCSVAAKEYDICYNSLDDDCDGIVDNPEYCKPEITCQNGRQDLIEEGIDCGGPCRPCKPQENPGFWFSLAFLGIIIFAVIGVLAMRGLI